MPLFLLALSALGGPWAAGASADDAAQIFDPSRMYVTKLTLPQESIDGLAADRDKYEPGTFSIAETNGTPGGVGAFSTPVGMKLKLKGSASYRPLGESQLSKSSSKKRPSGA